MDSCTVLWTCTGVQGLRYTTTNETVSNYEYFGFQTDKTFKTSYFYESYEPWWSVDLMIKTKIRMIRIVTAIGYKRSDFDGLQLLVGELVDQFALVEKCALLTGMQEKRADSAIYRQ